MKILKKLDGRTATEPEKSQRRTEDEHFRARDGVEVLEKDRNETIDEDIYKMDDILQ